MKVLLISDVHANLVALDAVLKDAGEWDAVWNLGDTVGYGPKPRECLDKMVDLFANPVLVGNHDLACIGEVDISEFNPVAQMAARWTSLQLGMDHRAYLNALPARTHLPMAARAHLSGNMSPQRRRPPRTTSSLTPTPASSATRTLRCTHC